MPKKVCIFCKQSSENSKSVEHIIPESMMPSDYVLPAGVVCDGCNNFFGSKIENPLLNGDYFRFLTVNKYRRFSLPIEFGPDKKLMSKFLGKLALEIMAEQSIEIGQIRFNEKLLNSKLDCLRNFVRYGKKDEVWPYHEERISEKINQYRQIDGKWYFASFTFTGIITDDEVYFICLIFKDIYTINIVRPSLQGYKSWLKDNNGINPLIAKLENELGFKENIMSRFDLESKTVVSDPILGTKHILSKKKCVFCKKSSENSKSVEHIVPESLLPNGPTLPVGIVCDSCNNYFGSKVEGPLLGGDYFKQARFRMKFRSKKGRYPKLIGFSNKGHIPVEIIVGKDGSSEITFLNSEDEERFNKEFKAGNKIISVPVAFPPDRDLMVRFLSKVAIEYMARHSIDKNENGFNKYYSLSWYDELREFARYGITKKTWLYHSEPIEGGIRSKIENGKQYFNYVSHSFIVGERDNLYFSFKLYEIEYVINVTRPEIDSYLSMKIRAGIENPESTKSVIPNLNLDKKTVILEPFFGGKYVFKEDDFGRMYLDSE